MKKHPLLVSLGLVFVMCFGLAFKCSDNNRGSGTDARDLTEDIVKQIITRRENNVTKSSMGPKSVTVTFESIQFGKPRKANEQDKIDGIPTDMVYPVRAKYTTVHHYSNENQEKNNHYDYEFYKDSYDEWAALGVGPVR